MLQIVGWKSLTKAREARDVHFGTLKTRLSYRFLVWRVKLLRIQGSAFVEMVSSRRLLKWWANVIARVIILGLLIYFSLDFGGLILTELTTMTSLEMKISLISIFIFCIFGLYFVFMLLKHFFEYSIKISNDGIFEIEGNKKVFYSFQNLREVKMYIYRAKNVYWEELNLNFVDHKKSLILQTRRFDNTRELNLAIINNSKIINPNIQIDSGCFKAY